MHLLGGIRLLAGTIALATIAHISPAAAAEPTQEEAETAAAASFAARRFAQAGRQYEELFARSGRPEHLLAAAQAYAAVRTPEARAYVDAIAGRYRELPGSDPAAMSRVLAAAEPTRPTSSTPAAQATPPSTPLIAPAAPRAQSYPVFPGAFGQPLPRAERRWYGWQTLIGLSVTDAMILGGSFGESSELIWAGAVGRALVPPIVHFAHGHELKGAASLLLNAGVPLAAGLVFGTALGEDPLRDSNFFLTGFYLGFVFSGPIAAAIDVAALSMEEVSVSPEATTLWPRSLMLTPIVGNGRAGLAVSGLL